MEKKEHKKKRLLVDVDEALHQEVKTRAIRRNITLRQWLLRAITDAIKMEKLYE